MGNSLRSEGSTVSALNLGRSKTFREGRGSLTVGSENQARSAKSFTYQVKVNPQFEGDSLSPRKRWLGPCGPGETAAWVGSQHEASGFGKLGGTVEA